MNDLKRQLLKKSVPVKRLAEFVSIDRSHCSKIINGHSQPSIELARQLAAAANMFTHHLGYYMPSDFSDTENVDDSYDIQVDALEQIIARSVVTYDAYRRNIDVNAIPLLSDFEAIKRLNDLVKSINGVNT